MLGMEPSLSTSGIDGDSASTLTGVLARCRVQRRICDRLRRFRWMASAEQSEHRESSRLEVITGNGRRLVFDPISDTTPLLTGAVTLAAVLDLREN